MTLLRAASLRRALPSLTTTPATRRTLCMPPFRSCLEASDNPIPTDQEALDIKSAPDVSAADGITPEAALAELRRLRAAGASPAELGVHTPTPIAPFTDVDPVTGKVVGPAKKGFFNRAT